MLETWASPFVGVDRRGSVVLYEFFGDPHQFPQLYTEIMEFASKLHIRLVSEYLYKFNDPEIGDEIIVFYVCPYGPCGSFRYRV